MPREKPPGPPIRYLEKINCGRIYGYGESFEEILITLKQYVETYSQVLLKCSVEKYPETARLKAAQAILADIEQFFPWYDKDQYPHEEKYNDFMLTCGWEMNALKGKFEEYIKQELETATRNIQPEIEVDSEGKVKVKW